MNVSSRKTRRIRKRGAAMVEAAVVMPVLIMFFGLLTFFYSAVTTKQEVMATSRNGAFTQALVGSCGGSGRSFPVKPDVPSGQRGVGEIAQKSGLESMTSQGLFTATGAARKNATNAPLSVTNWTKNVSAESYVYCSPATGLVDFMLEAVKAGLGAVRGAVGL